jgi:hypothetical protein
MVFDAAAFAPANTKLWTATANQHSPFGIRWCFSQPLHATATHCSRKMSSGLANLLRSS